MIKLLIIRIVLILAIMLSIGTLNACQSSSTDKQKPAQPQVPGPNCRWDKQRNAWICFGQISNPYHRIRCRPIAGGKTFICPK